LNKFNNFKKCLVRPEFSIIFVAVVLLLAVSLIIFFSLKNVTAQIKDYKNNLENISENLILLNEDLNLKISKSKSAELLINNTNPILSTIYYGSADTEELEGAKDFTAFSLTYRDKFFLITAGHCIEMDGEKYKNFRFKANDKSYFITPKLIDYTSDYTNNIDYAVFYDSNLIRSGLYPATDNEDKTPLYILGNLERDLNFIKSYSDARKGESGSPVLNSNCHVVGILIKSGGTFTPISVVLDALNRINDK
jgi:hypothetical protein